MNICITRWAPDPVISGVMGSLLNGLTNGTLGLFHPTYRADFTPFLTGGPPCRKNNLLIEGKSYMLWKEREKLWPITFIGTWVFCCRCNLIWRDSTFAHLYLLYFVIGFAPQDWSKVDKDLYNFWVSFQVSTFLSSWWPTSSPFFFQEGMEVRHGNIPKFYTFVSPDRWDPIATPK